MMGTMAFWHWWVAAVVLAAVEAFAPGVFLIWLGLAAAGVGIVAMIVPELAWEWQVLLFAAFSVVSIAVGRRYYRNTIETDDPTLNRRGEQYIGRVLTLTEPIVNGIGRTQVGDTMWGIEGEEDLGAGTRVKVVGVDGIRLRVERSV